MRKSSSLITKLAIGGLSFFAMTGAVLAESLDDYSSYYTTSSSDDAAAGVAALFSGGFVVLYICLFLIGCLALIFNVWMLVDIIKRTEVEVPNRTLWLVLLIVGLIFGFGWIVAIVYYFSVKKKLAAPVSK